ncbi:hypothetical protein NEOLEDRAFT_1158965 [Neolentinus lepideus HHB14362 ss-1]|uniref:Mid2 domain-containing protein n=1 Tax=Neolentinus lepideus HHB14362 ss-1 TaxID=1314782 RepID=A0A165NII4_9AGAM|nr:hypothetical protein NEOLEDRAFT_1158965 [Neolentinus lepideus HHB14362 ss-1]
MFWRSHFSLILFQLLWVFIGSADALPAGLTRTEALVRRQAASETVTTSSSGPVTQTCTVTLTPITDDNGNAAVREVESCVVTPGSSAAAGAAAPTVATSAAADNAPSSSAADSAPSSSAADSAPSSPAADSAPSSAAASSAAAATSAVSSAAASVGAAVSVDGFSSVSASVTATASASAAVSATAASAVSTASAAGASVSASANITPSAAAENAPTSAAAASTSTTSATQAAFVLPGTKLQVLPIGLGVFAGISVIALIVVGLVTYERTKYRKAFRARKLAEAGASMGYGGMA